MSEKITKTGNNSQGFSLERDKLAVVG